jgi:hypothetical protein
MPVSMPQRKGLSFRKRRRRKRNLLSAGSIPTHVVTAASAVSGAKRRPCGTDTPNRLPLMLMLTLT